MAYIPVISSVDGTPQGQSHNINADNRFGPVNSPPLRREAESCSRYPWNLRQSPTILVRCCGQLQPVEARDADRQRGGRCGK